MNPGASLTLYLGTAGNVEFIFFGGGDSSTEAVIVYEKGSTKGFDALTGGVGGYTVYKNGCRANAGDMRPYDVATYSSSTNTIRVSDTRLTGYYESCTPSPTEPASIRLLGHDFDVLPTAQSTMERFRPGDQITLLLTEDNKVAGAVKPGTAGAGANAIGIATSISGSSATVQLLCGIEIKGTVDLGLTSADQANETINNLRQEELNRMENRLVRVTSTGKNTIGLVRLGAVGDGSVIYGRTSVTVDDRDVYRIAVFNDQGQATGYFRSHYDINGGVYVAAVLSNDGTSFASLRPLDALKDVPNTAWSGQGAVTVDGRSYSIPASVMAYNRDTRAWISASGGKSVVEIAHAYAKKCSLYASEDGVVRIIEVGGDFR